MSPGGPLMLLGANPLIQVTPGLMIWTIVCFLIALFVLKRYAFGPIQKLIDERRERTRRALEAIRAEVAELSLIAAEKVTRRSLDDKDQRRLIDEAIGELDFSVLERND